MTGWAGAVTRRDKKLVGLRRSCDVECCITSRRKEYNVRFMGRFGRGSMSLRVVLLACALVLGGGQALFATNFSFTGAFGTDDQLQQFDFTLAAGSTVTLVTWSYAGGTNANGKVISQGGFDPWLSLYDSGGNLLQSVDNGTCGQVPADSVTGACFDSFISQPLGAGAYTLILSQSFNQPAGNTLADGFTEDGDPNGATFTSTFACSNGQFCDANSDNRTPQWAVDIDNVTTAAPSGVPEPGTVVLLGSGLAAIVLRRRRDVRN